MSGKITDAHGPAGGSVLVEGTATGIVTTRQGGYLLNLPEGDETLVSPILAV